MNTIIAFLSIAMMSCGQGKTATESAAAPVEKSVPAFNADSAYAFVKAQTDFGPRVPGSKASAECAQWLVGKLSQYGATDIYVQEAVVEAYNGDKLPIKNISASLNPELRNRVLLLAHWDSRPWADQEMEAALREKPIDGANDGASGVGVILELVRSMQGANPKTGIDVLFVDAEDYGRRAEETQQVHDEDTWCLGTQYWVANPTLDTKKLRYAILLDMVGGKNAVFPPEYFSDYAASDIVKEVRNAARKAGYADRFPNTEGAPVVDDHIYLLKAGIPAIDIIESNHPDTRSFNPTWHTHADNIDNIDANTLKAVGQTLMQLLY